MKKRTKLQQALVDLGACAPARRYVGALTLPQAWARSRREDPGDDRGHRLWLAWRAAPAETNGWLKRFGRAWYRERHSCGSYSDDDGCPGCARANELTGR